MSLLYAVFRVFREDLHEAQVVEKVFRKLILLIASMNTEQNMKEFFAVKCRIDEHVPHFVTNGLDFSLFEGFLDFNHISQGDHEMFLEIMKARFFPSLRFNQVLFVHHAVE